MYEFESAPGFEHLTDPERVIDKSTGTVFNFDVTDREMLAFGAWFDPPAGCRQVVSGYFGRLAVGSEERDAFHVFRTSELQAGKYVDTPAPLTEIAKFLNAIAAVQMSRSYAGKIMLIDSRNDQGGIGNAL